MMPIKYKVWDAHIEQMYGPEGLTLSLRDGLITFISVQTKTGAGYSEWSSVEEPLDQERYKLRQFTGLLDKNKKEIYEGDCLGDEDSTYRIVWEQDKAGFHLLVKCDGGVWDACMGGVWAFAKDGKLDDFDVIGNIYENPELLEAE